MEQDKTIIEVNGIKLEIDLRSAKRIDQFKIGDPVKILLKTYSDYVPHFGMIVGFDNFATRPTIIVAYIKEEYSGTGIHFAYINSDSKDVELCMSDLSDIPIEKASILEKMDVAIQKKKDEIHDLENKKQYFLKHFNQFFEPKQ